MFFFSKLESLISSNKNKFFQTPFGTISSEVSLFPLYYLFFIYLSGILPWEIWNGQTLFDLWGQHEYLAEHLQFIFYVSGAILSLINIFKNKYKLFSLQNTFWIIFFISLSFFSLAEVGYLIPLNEGIFQEIRSNSIQNEISFHTLKFFNPYLHRSFIFLNLFLGWFGWRYFSFIEAFPKKFFSLYFLTTALAYSILEIKLFSPSIFVQSIPILQEIFEFLMAMGIFLHALKMFKYYLKISIK